MNIECPHFRQIQLNGQMMGACGAGKMTFPLGQMPPCVKKEAGGKDQCPFNLIESVNNNGGMRFQFRM